MSVLFLAFALMLPGPDRAELEYAAGRFEQAHALYEAALAAGDAPQGELLFNLGNCAYRLNRHAEAVVLYRRALLRMPRDPKVRFNLFLAEQPLGLKATPSETFGARLLELVDCLTAREILLLAGALQSLGLIGFVLLRGRRGVRMLLALLVVLSLAGAGRVGWWLWGPSPREGLVLLPALELRPEPRLDLEPTLRLRYGEKVRVLERSERWMRVSHERGRGWTDRAGVGVVE